MICEQAMNGYLSLDKNERVPLSITMHLFVCPECRAAVRYLTRAEKLLSQPLETGYAIPLDQNASVNAVSLALSQISTSGLAYPVKVPEEYHVSLFRWLVSGVALAAGFTILPFSSLGAWSRLVYGNAFFVPFYIVCGVTITVYCGMFVGTNIDFFVKKFGISRTA